MTVGQPERRRERNIVERGQRGIRAVGGWGRVGVENMGPLLGDVMEYGAGCGGGGGGADPFQDV